MRVRVPAREVILATERVGAGSVRNLLPGRFEIGAAYLGGERSGGKLGGVVSFSSASIASWAERSLDPACRPR